MDWTAEQRQAIDLRGKNILVSAAAGSGKTAVLVERIKELLLRDRCPIDRMLVVTFTNAAAAEMKEKIHLAVEQAVEELTQRVEAGAADPQAEMRADRRQVSDLPWRGETDLAGMEAVVNTAVPDSRARGERGTADTEVTETLAFLRRQLDLLPQANISTFHAFALTVIRKYFYLIDVEPNFKICDGAEQTLLQADAMDRLLEEMFAENDPAFLRYMDKYSGDRNENDVRAQIERIYKTIQSLPDPVQWLHEKVELLRGVGARGAADGAGDSADDGSAAPAATAAGGGSGSGAGDAGAAGDRAASAAGEADTAVTGTEHMNGDRAASAAGEADADVDVEAREAFLLDALWEAAKNRLEAARALLQKNRMLASSLDLSAAVSMADRDMAALNSIAGLFTAERGGYETVREAFASFTLEKLNSKYFDGERGAACKDATQKNRNECKKIIKGLQTRFFSQSLEEIWQDMAATYADAQMIEKLVMRFGELYDEEKRRRNLLDFNDIEHDAYAILHDPEAAAFYREKFLHIFVDEYQDSNLIQEALVARICRPDNLFLVGDVKQSIYKFRLAEPEIFQRRYLAYRRGDERSVNIDLNRNFRSKQPVLDFVNTVCGSVMEEYDEAAALRPGDPYAERSFAEPVLHLVGASWDKGVTLDEEIENMLMAEKEALAAARIIADSLGQPIFDSKQGRERPLELQDIVILLRGVRNYGDIYYSVLTENGIPAFVEDDEGYFDTLEINTFLSLLTVLDNEKQDLPLLTVLRSEFLGFSVEELAAVRIACKEGSYYEAFCACADRAGDLPGSGPGVAADAQGADGALAAGSWLDPSGGWSGGDRSAAAPGCAGAAGLVADEGSGGSGPVVASTDGLSRIGISYDALARKCARARQKLMEWQRLSTFMPLEELVWKLMLDTDFYLAMGAMPGGRQRQANLRALVDRAAAYREGQNGSLYGFIRYIETVKARQVPNGQVKLVGEGDAIVRIMTIHKSKGLEFPMVILGGYCRRLQYSKPGSDILVHKDLGLGLPIIDPNAGYFRKTAMQNLIAEKMHQEEVAEEKRILYVALTRARDRLVLLGIARDLQKELEAITRRTPSDASYFSMTGEIICAALQQYDIMDDQALVALKGRRRRQASSALALLDAPAVEQEGADAVTGDESDSRVAPELAAEVDRRLSFTYPHQTALRTKSKYSVSELNARGAYREDLLPAVGPADEAEGGLPTAENMLSSVSADSGADMLASIQAGIGASDLATRPGRSGIETGVAAGPGTAAGSTAAGTVRRHFGVPDWAKGIEGLPDLLEAVGEGASDTASCPDEPGIAPGFSALDASGTSDTASGAEAPEARAVTFAERTGAERTSAPDIDTGTTAGLDAAADAAVAGISQTSGADGTAPAGAASRPDAGGASCPDAAEVAAAPGAASSGPTTTLHLAEPAFWHTGSHFTAAQRGTIYHCLLEHLDFRRAYAGGDMAAGRVAVVETCRWLVDDRFLTEEEVAVIDPDLVMKLFESPLGRRLAESRAVWREKPFNLKIRLPRAAALGAEADGRTTVRPGWESGRSFAASDGCDTDDVRPFTASDGWDTAGGRSFAVSDGDPAARRDWDGMSDGSGASDSRMAFPSAIDPRALDEREPEVIVQGIIDCFFEEGEELVLIDYKTSRIGRNPARLEAEKKRIADRYAVQIDIYRRALEAVTGRRVKESYIYLTDCGELVPM